ncbi:hypothetical protein [Microbacterium soli]|uniref:DUF3533 domain-containing protein n=1 Tax=Microbacterium soli TaxID=446075 RepID=A0ABP7NE07_9MICO
MIERLGPRKYAFPLLVVVLIGCVMALLFYPMLHMQPKNLPFAVLSLDEGATTPAGEVNAGEMMTEKLVTAEAPGDGEVAPIKWEVVDSQEALDDAIAENEYYGALTIPADFTKAQAAAQAGQGEAPSVHVVLDNAKSPMMATQMQTLMGQTFGGLGLTADIEVIHTGDADAAPVSPMAGMMSQQVGIMPLMIMSLIGSILLVRIFPMRGAETTGRRFGVLGIQLAYAAGYSLLASLAAVWLLNGVVGAAAPFWTTTVFLWFAAFAVTALFLGAFDVAFPLGVLLAIAAVLCGMMTAVLPPETLPAFWADWIQPWVPQPFIAGGLRDILYMGAGLMPKGSGGLLVIGGVGVILTLIAGFIPRRARAGVSPAAAEPEPVTA